MVYDIRNTRSHLHKLKDSSSQAPIHSLNVGQVNDSHSAVLCSNLVQSYVWNFKKDGDTPSYIPIETTPGNNGHNKKPILEIIKLFL